ncbi:hypothetical protein ACFX13_047656 [Malus domestica]
MTSFSLSALSPLSPSASTPHISKSKKKEQQYVGIKPAKEHLLPHQYVPISLSFHITCSVSQLQTAVAEAVKGRVFVRNEIRLGLPSKGSMAADTLDLLKDCQLPVKHVNSHQYVAQIPQAFISPNRSDLRLLLTNFVPIFKFSGVDIEI